MTDKPRALPEDTQFYSLGNLSEPIQDKEAFGDIATAIMRLSAAFKKHGFEAPTSIELASHDDGYRMRHILPRDMVMAVPTESLRGEDQTDVMFNIMGMEFRYPAKFRRERRAIKTL